MGERRAESVPTLKRTEFSSHGENPAQFARFPAELALSGALRTEKRRDTRRIIVFSRL